MIQAYYSLYRMSVFFWILIGLTWVGGVISMLTEHFNVSSNTMRSVKITIPPKLVECAAAAMSCCKGAYAPKQKIILTAVPSATESFAKKQNGIKGFVPQNVAPIYLIFAPYRKIAPQLRWTC